MNLKYNKILFLIVSLFLIHLNVFGQDLFRRPYGDVQKPFEYTVTNFKGNTEGQNIFNIVFEIPFDLINFEKDSTHFTGEYEITAYIYDRDYRLMGDSTETKKIRISDYQKTISKNRYSVHNWNFPVITEKDYRIKINFYNKGENREELNKELKFKAVEFNEKKIDMSDLIFNTSKYDSIQKRNVLIPNFREFSDRNDIVVFFEVYNMDAGDNIDVSYKIRNIKQKVIIEEKYKQKIKSGKDTVFIKINAKDIVSGSYNFEVLVKDGRREKKKERKFIYMWQGFPDTEAELAKAVEQMRYIKSGSVSKKMKKLPFEQKIEAFTEFWESKDPTPGTERNEFMEEYYFRIYFSNKAFRELLREGWETDRGRIFVTFGPPDEIYDRVMPAYGRSYQVWYYGGRGTEIIFVRGRLYQPDRVPWILGDMYDF